MPQSFPYLKRNQGIEQRYGRIQYPRFGSKKSNFSKMSQSESRLSPDSGRGTTSRTADFNLNENFISQNAEIVQRIRQSQVLFSPESNDSVSCVSDIDPHKNDVNSFELLEHLAENTSLSSDSSIVHQIAQLQKLNTFRNLGSSPDNPGHKLSTVAEVSESTEEKGLQQSLPPRLKKVLDKNLPEIDSGKSSSIRSEPIQTGTNSGTSSSQAFGFSLQLPPTLRNLLENDENLLFSKFPFVLPEHLRNKSPVLHETQNIRVESKIDKRDDRRLKMLEKRMRSMLDLLTKDADLLTELRLKLEQKSKDLAKDTENLKMKNQEFDTRMEKELDNLRKEYRDLDRERQLFYKEQSSVKKKDNEMVNILRTEITELNEKLNEKEATLSSSRYSMKELQKQLTQSDETLKTVQTRYRNLDAQLTKVNRENALLRCQNWKMNTENKEQRPEVSNLKKTSVQGATPDSGGPKTVRFLLPDPEPVFRRTENRSVQTTEDSGVQTSIIMTQPVKPTFQPMIQETLERTKPDGSKEIIHPSGTVEVQNIDGSTVYTYTNGDTRKIDIDLNETYHFAQSNISQTRLADGETRIHYFQDKRSERHLANGDVIIETADAVRCELKANGRQTIHYPNSTVEEVGSDGQVEQTTFPDGSREIYRPEYTKREWLNGDVKFKYKDGSEETRLKSGRIRIKDAQGNVIRDEIVKSDDR